MNTFYYNNKFIELLKSTLLNFEYVSDNENGIGYDYYRKYIINTFLNNKNYN